MKNNHPSKKQQHPSKKVPQQAVAQERAEVFPEKVPFWARLKIGGKHPSLIIDKENVLNKSNKKIEEGFVYRESTHKHKKGREEINPNPDKNDKKPMYLKRAQKKPKRLFEPINKKLDMPEFLRKRYEKNNK